MSEVSSGPYPAHRPSVVSGHRGVFCLLQNLPCGVAFIRVAADRLFVGDLRESVHVMKYRLRENLFHVLADDVVPR